MTRVVTEMTTEMAITKKRITAEKQGYMVVPDDIDKFDQTAYFHLKHNT